VRVAERAKKSEDLGYDFVSLLRGGGKDGAQEKSEKFRYGNDSGRAYMLKLFLELRRTSVGEVRG